jgi:hypothetical protein
MDDDEALATCLNLEEQMDAMQTAYYSIPDSILEADRLEESKLGKRKVQESTGESSSAGASASASAWEWDWPRQFRGGELLHPSFDMQTGLTAASFSSEEAIREADGKDTKGGGASSLKDEEGESSASQPRPDLVDMVTLFEALNEMSLKDSSSGRWDPEELKNMYRGLGFDA